MKDLKLHDVNYTDAKSVWEALQEYFSNTEIRRKLKEGSIRVGADTITGYTWIKAGKTHIILAKEGGWNTAYLAQLWWTYHFQVMPKLITFNPYNLEDFQSDRDIDTT